MINKVCIVVQRYLSDVELLYFRSPTPLGVSIKRCQLALSSLIVKYQSLERVTYLFERDERCVAQGTVFEHSFRYL